MANFELFLDVKKSTSRVPAQVVVRVGDVSSQTIVANLTNGSSDYSPAGTARLDILKADNTWARCVATLSGSHVSCTLPAAAVSSPGLCRLAHFVFTNDSVIESTEGFELRILDAVETSGQAAKDYDDQLQKLYDRWLVYEQSAKAAESARQTAERDRLSSERQRVSSETTRSSAEDARVTSEAQRTDHEHQRVSAESRRLSSEDGRVYAEHQRASAETLRASAESDRISAESMREQAQEKNNADQKANNAAAQGLQVVKLSAGQYNSDTLEPTIQGQVGRLYFVPVKKVVKGNVFVEWMWIDSAWERVGMSDATITALTTGEIDTVTAGSQLTSESVLNGSVLTYFWSKLKGIFALKRHGHSTSDIYGQFSLGSFPTIPVYKGGTGATTPVEAREALGAASQDDLSALDTPVSQKIKAAGDWYVGETEFTKVGHVVSAAGWAYRAQGLIADTIFLGFPPVKSSRVCGWLRTDATKTISFLQVNENGEIITNSDIALSGETGFMYNISYIAK